MADYTVNLTDTQDKALSYNTTDIQEWVNIVVNNAARQAIDEIIDIYTKRALDEGVQIPITKDAIVTDAFTREWVKTAVQRNIDSAAANE